MKKYKEECLVLPRWQLQAAHECIEFIHEEQSDADYRASGRAGGGWSAMRRGVYPTDLALIFAKYDPKLKKAMEKEKARPKCCPDNNPPVWK